MTNASRTHDAVKLSGLGSRFAAFVAERHPFALPLALDAFESRRADRRIKGRDAVKLDAARPVLRRALAKSLYDTSPRPKASPKRRPA